MGEKAYTSYKVHKECTLSSSTAYAIVEAGNNQLPSLDSLEQFCDAIGITLSDFFRQDGKRVELTDAEQEIIIQVRRCDKDGAQRIEAYARGIADGITRNGKW